MRRSEDVYHGKLAEDLHKQLMDIVVKFLHDHAGVPIDDLRVIVTMAAGQTMLGVCGPEDVNERVALCVDVIKLIPPSTRSYSKVEVELGGD